MLSLLSYNVRDLDSAFEKQDSSAGPKHEPQKTAEIGCYPWSKVSSTLKRTLSVFLLASCRLPLLPTSLRSAAFLPIMHEFLAAKLPELWIISTSAKVLGHAIVDVVQNNPCTSKSTNETTEEVESYRDDSEGGDLGLANVKT